MIPFAAFAVMIAVSFSLFLFNTFGSFKNFYLQARSFSIWDTMTLAATNRVTRETNSFLLKLQDSLIKSLESFNNGQVDSSLNQERLSLVNDYLAQLDLNTNSPLKSTIEFGLQPFDNKGAKNYSNSYNASLVHSDYFNNETINADKNYASTLISNEHVARTFTVDDLESQIIAGDNLKISSDLLLGLVGQEALNTIQANQAVFNIEVTDAGMGLNNLPNGIQVDIITPIQNQS